MKKHLVITCLAYFLFGVSVAVIKSDVIGALDPVTRMVILIVCIVFYLITVFTSMEKLKKYINEKETS